MQRSPVCQSVLKRILYIQNKSRFHAVQNASDVQPHRFEIAKFKRNKHLHLKHKYRSCKKKRIGKFQGLYPLHGSEPDYPDPNILSIGDLPLVCRQAAVAKLQNGEFWRLVAEKVRSVRDLLSVGDIATILDCFVSVNYRHPDLLKLLSRELRDGVGKLHAEEIAVIANSYAHFNCYSPKLFEKMTSRLYTYVTKPGEYSTELQSFDGRCIWMMLGALAKFNVYEPAIFKALADKACNEATNYEFHDMVSILFAYSRFSDKLQVKTGPDTVKRLLSTLMPKIEAAVRVEREARSTNLSLYSLTTGLYSIVRLHEAVRVNAVDTGVYSSLVGLIRDRVDAEAKEGGLGGVELYLSPDSCGLYTKRAVMSPFSRAAFNPNAHPPGMLLSSSSSQAVEGDEQLPSFWKPVDPPEPLRRRDIDDDPDNPKVVQKAGSSDGNELNEGGSQTQGGEEGQAQDDDLIVEQEGEGQQGDRQGGGGKRCQLYTDARTKDYVGYQDRYHPWPVDAYADTAKLMGQIGVAVNALAHAHKLKVKLLNKPVKPVPGSRKPAVPKEANATSKSDAKSKPRKGGRGRKPTSGKARRGAAKPLEVKWTDDNVHAKAFKATAEGKAKLTPEESGLLASVRGLITKRGGTGLSTTALTSIAEMLAMDAVSRATPVPEAPPKETKASKGEESKAKVKAAVEKKEGSKAVAEKGEKKKKFKKRKVRAASSPSSLGLSVPTGAVPLEREAFGVVGMEVVKKTASFKSSEIYRVHLAFKSVGVQDSYLFRAAKRLHVATVLSALRNRPKAAVDA